MINLPKMYSQKSLPWAKEKLGFSELEIEDFGCLVTDLTNICNYFGFSCNPSNINEKLKGIKGFSCADYVWGSLSKIFTDISEKYNRTAHKLLDEEMAQIKNSIRKNNPVMLWLDYNPKTVKNDMHWVVAIDWNDEDENDITIADPIDGKMRSLKEYLGWFMPTARRTIQAFVVYEKNDVKETANLEAENEILKLKIKKAINLLNQ